MATKAQLVANLRNGFTPPVLTPQAPNNARRNTPINSYLSSWFKKKPYEAEGALAGSFNAHNVTTRTVEEREYTFKDSADLSAKRLNSLQKCLSEISNKTDKEAEINRYTSSLSPHQRGLAKLINGIPINGDELASLQKQKHRPEEMLFILAFFSKDDKPMMQFIRQHQGVTDDNRIYACRRLMRSALILENSLNQSAEQCSQYKKIRANAAELALTIGDEDLKKQALNTVFLYMNEDELEAFQKRPEIEAHLDPTNLTDKYNAHSVYERNTLLQERHKVLEKYILDIESANTGTQIVAYKALGMEPNRAQPEQVLNALGKELLEANPGTSYKTLARVNRLTAQSTIKTMITSDSEGNKFLEKLKKVERKDQEILLSLVQMLEREGSKTGGALLPSHISQKKTPYDPEQYPVLELKGAYGANPVNANGNRTQEEETIFEDMRSEAEEMQTTLTPDERSFCLLLASKIASQVLDPANRNTHLDRLIAKERNTLLARIDMMTTKDPTGEAFAESLLTNDTVKNLQSIQFFIDFAYKPAAVAAAGSPAVVAANEQQKALCLKIAAKIAEKSNGRFEEASLYQLLAQLENSGDAKKRELALVLYRSDFTKRDYKTRYTAQIPHIYVNKTELSPEENLAVRNLAYRAWTPGSNSWPGNIVAGLDKNIGITTLAAISLVLPFADLALSWGKHSITTLTARYLWENAPITSAVAVGLLALHQIARNSQ